jgi:hypothetical protein
MTDSLDRLTNEVDKEQSANEIPSVQARRPSAAR